MGALIKMQNCPFCGSGNNTPCFAVYTDGYHCYTCGKHKQEGVTALAYRPNIEKPKFEIPEFTTNINNFSPIVLQWLYKYYVMDRLIKKYNIGYALESESLLFTVMINNHIEFWQQRFFPKGFKTGGHKNVLLHIHNQSPTIVLVEDYISAIRLGEHTNVLCLWGTNLTNTMLTYLLMQSLDIAIWLDNDEPGKKAALKIFTQLNRGIQNYNINKAFSIQESRTISIINTDKQSKEYCDSEIRQILGE